jgi:hypothetical protein
MRPHGRARVNPTNPEGFGECDRCGLIYNLVDFEWQFEYAGMKLQNTHILVCDTCLDVPQPQLRTIILPPDPPPLLNARPPNYAYEEQTPLVTQFSGAGYPPYGAGPAMIMCDQSGEIALLMQYTTST